MRERPRTGGQAGSPDLKDQLEDMRAQRDGWQMQAEGSQRQLVEPKVTPRPFGWFKAS